MGQMTTGEKVLVTAAAGGTGQLVVQLAKLAGNHVIATCGSQDKAELLKKLGADRVINYRTEDVKDVLRREYPKVRETSTPPTTTTPHTRNQSLSVRLASYFREISG